MGPTAGYLVSFPMAAAISGLLAERGWTGKRVFASFISQYAANILLSLSAHSGFLLPSA